MPFINVKTNVKISRENEVAIKTMLGEAIALIPGKSEKSIMLSMEESRMWFRGTDEPCAMVSVWALGQANRDGYDKMTSKICTDLEEILHISASRIYIKYSETLNWGCNGSNF